MTIIEQIKAEIERRMKELDEQIVDIYDSKAVLRKDELQKLFSFTSTLESEKPMNLVERIGSYNIVPYIDDKISALQDMWREEKVSFDWDDLKDMIEDVARHFAQWGAEHLADARKTSPKDLEEAANEFANQDCVTFISRKKGFIAGAKWNMDKMMKEAVEGRVFMSFAPGHNQMVMADVDLPTNTNVRVIVLPKED